MDIILKHSPFHSKEELLKQFDEIEGETGKSDCITCLPIQFKIFWLLFCYEKHLRKDVPVDLLREKSEENSLFNLLKVPTEASKQGGRQ